MNLIHYSEEESDFFNLKIGRGKMETIEPVALEKAILNDSYDVCRIKVSAGELDAVQKLDALRFPCYHAGEVINYTISLDEIKKMNLDAGDHAITFELYNGSQKKIVSDIILKNCADDPIGYYKTPFLNKLITARQETKFLASYFSETYVSENKLIFLMKKNDAYAGLIAYAIENSTLDSLLVTLTPEHRHYTNLSHFIRETFRFAKARQLNNIVCGARLNNRMMQHIFEKHGRKNGADIIYHITPFLSAGSETAKEIRLRNKIGNFFELDIFSRKQSQRLASRMLKETLPYFSAQKICGNAKAANAFRLSIQTLTAKKNLCLYVLKAFDKKEKLLWTACHSYSPRAQG